MEHIASTSFEDNTSQAERNEMEGKYLTFWTDGQLFGVPIFNVVQIVGVQSVTVIPDYPSYAKGIINLRGSIIPVIDMRLRLGREEADYDDRTCTIVISMRDSYFGFIVDEVDEVTNIDAKKIAPPPTMGGMSSAGDYITGVAQLENRLVLLLDAARLLGSEDWAAMMRVVE